MGCLGCLWGLLIDVGGHRARFEFFVCLPPLALPGSEGAIPAWGLVCVLPPHLALPGSEGAFPAWGLVCGYAGVQAGRARAQPATVHLLTAFLIFPHPGTLIMSFFGGRGLADPGGPSSPFGEVGSAQGETPRRPPGGPAAAGPPGLTHAPGQAPRTMMGRGQTWRDRVRPSWGPPRGRPPQSIGPAGARSFAARGLIRSSGSTGGVGFGLGEG